MYVLRCHVVSRLLYYYLYYYYYILHYQIY